MMTPKITRVEVSKHKFEEDLWCVIDAKVYDLTDFVNAHPGGVDVLKEIAGSDCTDDFYNLHRHEILQRYRHLQIGVIDGEGSKVVDPAPGDLSLVPYAEPTWLTPEYSSPYFGKSHHRLRKAMRTFVDMYIYPEAQQREQSGTRVSPALIKRMSKSGILHMRLGPGKHLTGKELLGGVVMPEEFDSFHDLIVTQELVRTAARGFQDGNLLGMTIGLPLVLRYANDERTKETISSECFSGTRLICLAVTEPFAGSDVANIRTSAVLSKDGQYYTVSGTKKWITNGTFCDYFVTAAKSRSGIVALVIERGEGVETAPVKTSYSSAAGTALVIFSSVRVPTTRRLGKEGEGLQIILSNFNHERWLVAASISRQMRLVTEDCMKWCNQRIAFGKRLAEQPVIRQKLATMIAHCEANQAWVENITYQMINMPDELQSKVLAGPIGLLKMHATRSAHTVADHAVQIFGGRGITQTGMGRVAEMFHRTYKFDAIPGGSEEILADLGVRQAFKSMPRSML